MGERIRSFRERLVRCDPLIGTFVKTPSPIVCEILARAAMDVVCLDTEHAPFGRMETDGCLSALRALDQPSLVRVGTQSPTEICRALDSGATGILVPHVTSASQAGAIVSAAHYGAGGRGFSGSTRAADFGGRSISEHVADSNARTAVIVQIEDAGAIDSVQDIAAVDGVDGIFIGRVDLAVSMGRDPLDFVVIEAVSAICAAGRNAGVAVGMFTPANVEIARWRAAGASLFLLGSDQAFVLSGARELAAAFHAGGNRDR